MLVFELPRSTRGQVAVAAAHILMLAGALAVAWRKDGPPPEKAFWAILGYFVEIAVVGVVEVAVAIAKRRASAGHEWGKKSGQWRVEPEEGGEGRNT